MYSALLAIPWYSCCVVVMRFYDSCIPALIPLRTQSTCLHDRVYKHHIFIHANQLGVCKLRLTRFWNLAQLFCGNIQCYFELICASSTTKHESLLAVVCTALLHCICSQTEHMLWQVRNCNGLPRQPESHLHISVEGETPTTHKCMQYCHDELQLSFTSMIVWIAAL